MTSRKSRTPARCAAAGGTARAAQKACGRAVRAPPRCAQRVRPAWTRKVSQTDGKSHLQETIGPHLHRARQHVHQRRRCLQHCRHGGCRFALEQVERDDRSRLTQVAWKGGHTSGLTCAHDVQRRQSNHTFLLRQRHDLLHQSPQGCRRWRLARLLGPQLDHARHRSVAEQVADEDAPGLRSLRRRVSDAGGVRSAPGS